jgi:hypothetical protein
MQRMLLKTRQTERMLLKRHAYATHALEDKTYGTDALLKRHAYATHGRHTERMRLETYGTHSLQEACKRLNLGEGDICNACP